MMVEIIRSNTLRFAVCLFLAVITLITFWKIQENDFINLDDNLYITDNPHIKNGLTLNNLRWAFSKVHAGHWHPMTWLSHMIDVELFGLHPGGHHLVSLIFHTINSLLLFLLFHKMTGRMWGSAFIAGFFAIHPLRVESVAWAAERKDVLCAFFFILTIYAYIYYIEKKKVSHYVLILLFFILSLMSKPMAVTLPFVLLLLDYWPFYRFKPTNMEKWQTVIRLIIEKIPLFVLTTLMSIFTYINHLQSGAVTSFDKLPIYIRIGNACISYIRYIWKMLWPDSLAVLYPHPIHLPFWEVIGAIFLLILITIAVTFFRRKHPYLIIGWFWYLGTLIPVIGLVQAGIQSMADRFTYIPMIGVYLMIVFGISNLLKRSRLICTFLIPSGICILLILAYLTSLQVDRWKNSITLFTHTLNETSNNYLIHNNLGVSFMRLGRYGDAEAHVRKALEINPNYADAYHNLGTIRHLQGDVEESFNYFSQALKLSPQKVETLNAIGGLLEKQGQPKEAMAYFSKAIQIHQDYAEAHYNLGTLYLRLGKVQEASDHLNQSLKIDPGNAKAYHNLGLAFEALGKNEEAIKLYRESIRFRPGNADSHFCLASALLKIGKKEEAILHFKETLKLNPDDSDAHYQLGNIFYRQQSYELAKYHLLEAVRINPNHKEAQYLLDETYLIKKTKSWHRTD